MRTICKSRCEKRSEVGEVPKIMLFSIVGLMLLAGFLGCKGNNDTQPIADSPDISADLPPIAPSDFGAARSFQLENLAGDLVSLNDYQEQVVAINFWATWCNPCRKEIPDLVKIQNRYRERGVIVLGLSRDVLNQNGQLVKNEEAVQSFVKEFKINYPVLWDTEDVYNEHYGAIGMPTTIILDRKHRIRFRHTGIIDIVTLDAEITTILNET